MGGGIFQAYTTMGFCTFMKTVEVTRHKGGADHQSTIQVAREILKKEGIRGINKGVNAVAVRQCTNWGSRFLSLFSLLPSLLLLVLVPFLVLLLVLFFLVSSSHSFLSRSPFSFSSARNCTNTTISDSDCHVSLRT